MGIRLLKDNVSAWAVSTQLSRMIKNMQLLLRMFQNGQMHDIELVAYLVQTELSV